VTIRATFFDGAEKAVGDIVAGKTYMFYGGQLRNANDTYNVCSSKFEFNFGKKASYVELEGFVGYRWDDDSTPLRFVPISDLVRGEGSQSIRATIYHMSEVKSYTSEKTGEPGSVLSIDLQDGSGATIRGVFFNDAAQKFYAELLLEHEYTFVGGSLKESEHEYDDCTSPYEFRFEAHCEIEPTPFG
jgi:hypothetical protein